MLKLLTITCLFLALSTVHSTSCSATSSLRSSFGLGNTLTDAQNYTDIKYCKSIKNSAVCCTNTDMNSFADKSAAILTSLTSLVASRDKYIKNVQDTVLPSLKTNLASLNTGFDQFASMFKDLGAATNDTDSADALSLITNGSALLTAATANLKTDFVDYQKARTTCVVELVKLQNAAFCLACDPAATSKGYDSSSGSFSLSTKVCNRLLTACVPYVTASSNQNFIVQASYGASIITTLNTIITKVNAGDMSAINNLNFETLFTTPTAASSVVDVASAPTSCTASKCDFICQDVFSKGKLNQEMLVVAGYQNSTSTGRLLEGLTKSDFDDRRLSSSGDFDPDSDEAGVTVTFTNDPGNTQSTSKSGSLSFGSVMVSMMVAVSAILLF